MGIVLCGKKVIFVLVLFSSCRARAFSSIRFLENELQFHFNAADAIA